MTQFFFPVERMLTPGEVAEVFHVDPKTVSRWAKTGRLRSIRTPGGHHRFPESEVRKYFSSLAPRGRTGEPVPPPRGRLT